MTLTDNALAKYVCGNWNVVVFGKLENFLAKPMTSEFNACPNNRISSLVDPFLNLTENFLQILCITSHGGWSTHSIWIVSNRLIDHITGQLNVDRLFVMFCSLNHTVDFISSPTWV